MSKEKVRDREFLDYIWIEKKMMLRPFIFLFEFQKELWYIWQLVGESFVWVFCVYNGRMAFLKLLFCKLNLAKFIINKYCFFIIDLIFKVFESKWRRGCYITISF